MNKIILNRVFTKNNKVEFYYDVIGEWKKYFNQDHYFYMEYNTVVNDVPDGIMAISFALSVLPVVWIFDAELIIPELDQRFYESINEFKQGFVNMYPMIDFKGQVNVGKIIDYSYETTDAVGAFFSGGVDATSTLVSHLSENPILINIHGSDINVNDDVAIKMVEENITKTAEQFGLKSIFVTSTFKNIVNRKEIDKYLVPIAKDTYWHGFQHGLAIIGHAAAIAWIMRLKRVYIASTFTAKDNMTCASDPTIDNYVKLSSTSVLHDGYEYDRIGKLKNIDSYNRNHEVNFYLRVCFDEHRATNCCECEKCYRTIYELLSIGCNPQNYGFSYDCNFHKKVEKDFKTKIVLKHVVHWNKIKKSLYDMQHPDVRWIYSYDFEKENRGFKRVVKILNRKRNTLIKKLKRKLKKRQ